MKKFVGVAAFLAVAACSGAEEADDGPMNATEMAEAEADREADGNDVGMFDCISVPSGDSRKDNDILGIDIGMSADDAIAVANCNEEGLTVEVVEDTSVSFPDGSRPRGAITLKNKGDLINVFLIGLPQKEKVYGIVRVKEFSEGSEPTMEQLRASLNKKYDPVIGVWPVSEDDPNARARAFSPSGAALPENKSGDSHCASYFGQNNGLGQLNEACGFTKKFKITPRYQKEDLAGEFSIWLGDQAALMAAANSVITAARQAQNKARQAEVEAAAEAGNVPEL